MSEDETIATVSLNGAQISGLLAIVDAFNIGTLSFESAVELITSAFPFSAEQAKKILGKKKNVAKE